VTHPLVEIVKSKFLLFHKLKRTDGCHERTCKEPWYSEWFFHFKEWKLDN
jgi:hypothetical protein